MMLEIDGWKNGMKFAAAHFVPSHNKCSRLHGHEYGVKIRIYGEPKNCMLYDFVELKKVVRKICDEIDHHIIIPKSKEYIKSEIRGDSVFVEFQNKKYLFPKEDVVFLEIKISTAEELSRYLGEKIVREIEFPDNLKGIEVCVEEGPGQGSWYYIPLGD